MVRTIGTEKYYQKPNRRMMIFIDGENLVCRYQAMLKKGHTPRKEIFHEPDVAVWSPAYSSVSRHHEILRATYYTYATGDETRIETVRSDIKAQQFNAHQMSELPRNLTPCVFKKEKKAVSGKGVDIQLCVDVLSHVYGGNADAIHLKVNQSRVALYDCRMLPLHDPGYAS